jgi:hypothetical protein
MHEALAAGTSVAHYRIIPGAGGMGEVYQHKTPSWAARGENSAG